MDLGTPERSARTLLLRADLILGKERADALRPALEEAVRALVLLYRDPPALEEFPAFYRPPEAQG